jgi:hypothetical protein
MITTPIIAWNPILTGSGFLQASIYIKPNLEILKFFNRAVFHRGVVSISGTNSCYDGPNRFATIDKSSDIPDCRHNFYNSTGIYVITLDCVWQGYPLELGVVEFKEGVVNEIIHYLNPTGNSLSTIDNGKILEEVEMKSVMENKENNQEIVEKYEAPKMSINECSLDKMSLALTGIVIFIFICCTIFLK